MKDIQAFNDLANKVVEESQDELRDLIKSSIKSGFIKYIEQSWHSPFSEPLGQINKIVFSEEFKNEIANELKQEIEAQRPILLELSRKYFNAQVIALHEGMFKHFLEVMQTDWKRNDFFKVLFKKEDE